MFNLTQAENLLENFKRINSALPVKDKQTTDDNQESLEKITTLSPFAIFKSTFLNKTSPSIEALKFSTFKI